MSSVESIFPMLGVSAVVFQGRGLPHIGMPPTMWRVPTPVGGKTITSKRDLRSGVCATTCVLRYV